MSCFVRHSLKILHHSNSAYNFPNLSYLTPPTLSGTMRCPTPNFLLAALMGGTFVLAGVPSGSTYVNPPETTYSTTSTSSTPTTIIYTTPEPSTTTTLPTYHPPPSSSVPPPPDCSDGCGGVCGDGIVQPPYEQCDLGPKLNVSAELLDNFQNILFSSHPNHLCSH